MAQPSIAAFFNTRKRAAAEDAIGLKNRVSGFMEIIVGMTPQCKGICVNFVCVSRDV